MNRPSIDPLCKSSTPQIAETQNINIGSGELYEKSCDR